MDKNDTTPDETPFNMAMLFYIRLNDLIAKKDTAAINHNYIGWYDGLRAIYRNIFFKIDKGDKDDLNGMFKKANQNLNIPSIRNRNLASQISMLAISGANKTLDEIDCKLMVIMDKKKMIFPSIESKGGLKSVLKKYGLGETKSK